MKKVRDNWSLLLIGVFFAVSIVYLLVNGTAVYVQTHDNLDSNVVYYKMLKDNHLFFAHDAKVPFLGGVDRDYIGTEFNLYAALFMLLPTPVAYFSAYFLKTIMSIYGAALLLRTASEETYKKNKNIVYLVGFLYGVMPYFPTCGFAFASLPLVLTAFIKIYRDQNTKLIPLLFFYPFLSSFFMFGIFMCGYILVFFIIDFAVNKKPAWRMLLALMTLALGFVVAEYRLFYVVLFSGVPTLRGESGFAGYSADLKYVLKTAIKALIFGQYHSVTGLYICIIPTCGIYFISTNVNRANKRQWKCILTDPFNWIIALACFNALLYGLDGYIWFKKTVAFVIPALNGFSFARSLWFNCFLWCMAFCIAMIRLRNAKFKTLAYVLCVAATSSALLTPATYNDFRHNFANAVREVAGINNPYSDELTWKEFYSEKLFDKIKEDISYDGEYSVALGYHPAVLNYNGIATLDGYLSMYPQAYKEEFAALIAPEMEVNPEKKNYFTSWGGRAYVFNRELDFFPQRYTDVSQVEMRIDPEAFTDMGGVYVFSLASISNSDELGLVFINSYVNVDSPYRMYVYKNAYAN